MNFGNVNPAVALGPVTGPTSGMEVHARAASFLTSAVTRLTASSSAVALAIPPTGGRARRDATWNINMDPFRRFGPPHPHNQRR